MTNIYSLILTVALVLFGANAFAEDLRCTGDVTWGGMNTKVYIDIKLPTAIDAVVSVPSVQRSAKSVPVGRGHINIREMTGSATQSRAFDFYVTSLDTGIITGFFIEGTLGVYFMKELRYQ